ncbi:MAG: hypothetical protein F6K48_03210 [Okeania sp. SIO3H1]|nr:hypothetical protein [Okeania sp. SIO3H1]
MPVFELSHKAPEDQNSLAGFEGIGRMGTGAPGVFTGSTPSPTASTQAKVDATKPAGFWSQTADFFKSDGFNNLLNTGLQTYQAREAQKAAERQANLAEQRSKTEQLLAMEEIKNSRQERELQARLASIQSQQVQAQAQMQNALTSSGGMPSWAIPAAIGGAGLLLVFVLMRNKK